MKSILIIILFISSTSYAGLLGKEPPKDFLNLEIAYAFVYPDRTNVGTSKRVFSLLKKVEENGSKISWNKVSKNTWVMTASRKDPMTNKRAVVKFQFNRISNLAVIQRLVVDNSELKPVYVANIADQILASVPIDPKLERDKNKVTSYKPSSKLMSLQVQDLTGKYQTNVKSLFSYLNSIGKARWVQRDKSKFISFTEKNKNYEIYIQENSYLKLGQITLYSEENDQPTEDFDKKEHLVIETAKWSQKRDVATDQ